MPDFSIALTGLQADTVALNTIGNNLANLNTTAYKGQTTSFEDLFYQQIGTSGASDPEQVGVGTRVSGTETNYTQGSLSTTSNSTDMALSGTGFFVVEQGGQQSLTRAGNFQLDSSGDLQTIDGESVMGFPTVAGTVSQTSNLAPITLPVGQTEPAQATQNVSISANLNSAAAVGNTFSTAVTVYDSLGQSHVATVTYTKASSTTWNYAVTLPSADASGAPVNNTGTLTFDSTGALVSPSSNVTGITFPGMADGASSMNFSMNLYNSAGAATVSQSASANNVAASSQDGYASGTYESFAVDSTGIVSATFSNGHTTTVGQVAVATVSNQSGLLRTGDNNFQTTAASGTASVGTAGTGGRATIEDDTVEGSNVDISAEFSNLVVAQRSFEANSKTVTTFDTVTQDAISMIR
ncbi:flagellar hook protein FlgE [Granulicella arctica]|uniref:Flagellar hook protein FlgE n=1 Tax=Granulicella arctica TaxID=940613 RepID=A0A7Y9PJL7_9BACT|nr:flagellar hook protein FlgE [Granulicella arctica]NYF80346.1 flagellar hook protein FlgE [Granulicella arctica]